MNIFRWELRFMRNNVLWWSLVLCALALVFIAMYPAFANDIAVSKALVDKLPVVLQQAFGLTLEVFLTFNGFYSYMMGYLALATAVQAMILGVSAVGREPSLRTTDFLLTKPVPRWRIFIAKVAAGLVMVTMTSSVFSLCSYAAARVVVDEDFDVAVFGLISSTMFWTALWFLAAGALVAALLPRVKSVISVSLGFVLFFFCVGLLESVIQDEQLRYLTPFKYFDYAFIMSHTAFEGRYLALGGLLVLAALSVALLVYSRKDAHSVM